MLSARYTECMRTIGLIGYHGADCLDLSGPAEVFEAATRLLNGTGGYRIQLYTLEQEAEIRTTSLPLLAHAHYSQAPALHTVLVAGGLETGRCRNEPEFLDWLRTGNFTRLGSVCTGAFWLAEAGLLRRRKATTHWAYCERLARHYPEVCVLADRIYVQDDYLYTSAGVTAGMDLALALVEQDHGRELALLVAKYLVLFLRRPGGQSQYSVPLQAQQAEHPGIRGLQSFLLENLEKELSVESLAEHAHLSVRHFGRLFRAQVGCSPARYVEKLRVEAACRQLQTSERSIEEISRRVGFGSPEILRRAFWRVLHTSPQDYRNHFQ